MGKNSKIPLINIDKHCELLKYINNIKKPIKIDKYIKFNVAKIFKLKNLDKNIKKLENKKVVPKKSEESE